LNRSGGKMLKKSIFYKFIVIFIIISTLPLIIFDYFISKDFETTVYDLLDKTEIMGRDNFLSSQAIGTIAIENAVSQLDAKSTEAIELRTVELASRIAEFLIERDHDALTLALSPPSPDFYLQIFNANKKAVILAPEQPQGFVSQPDVSWKNENNKTSWHHVPPAHYKMISRPIYREITFVDLQGMEQVKVRDGKISNDLRNIAIQENTYCKAEDYFKWAGTLKRGELYVSKVIGQYINGWLYKEGGKLKVKEESAYAGKENRTGKRFEGIVRWVTPVYQHDKKIGYVTLALDHTHIMEFTDHVVPSAERFSAISDASTGNYAFLWDCDQQSISHPRDFFICGYDPATGQEVPGWISQKTYDEYVKSGLTLGEFVKQLPSFRNFSNTKKGSKDQLEAGTIGLDCRILDHAPQCEGWSRGTADGGSGSFLIYWSGLWKLTTYASVPYHTGQYANSPRGFGYVTLGANIEDFHQPAAATKERIEATIRQQQDSMISMQAATKDLIGAKIAGYRTQATMFFLLTVFSATGLAVFLGLTLVRPLRKMSKSAQAIGDGDYNQSIDIHSRDEIGQLGDSLNKMARDIAESNQRLMEEISVRHKAEEALMASEKRYRDIFESAIEGIVQTTFSGKVIACNQRLATMYGFDSPQEMIEAVANVEEQLYVDVPQRLRFIESLLRDGSFTNFEAEIYKKNRDTVWISMNARVVYDDSNEPMYIEGFVIDISERKAAEAKNRELQERLIRSQKMEALGLLAGGVAHDLNNVLAGIVGYPQLLLAQLSEESPMKKKLIAIQNSGIKAADIVQDLLTLARRGVSTSEVINLNEIIQGEMASLGRMAKNRSRGAVAIETTLNPELLCIKGSSTHLKKTLMNLCSNALDAVAADGHIAISTENRYVDSPISGYAEISEGDYVLLTVTDDGSGIDAEDLKNIFEPFYTTKQMGRSGTGLGMSVIWGTVQDHGGYINIESKLGQGTTIQLYFPATREECSSQNEKTDPEEFSGEGESILVVDDVAEQRELAKTLLSALNYDVHVASSGEEAVEYLKQHTVDLLILDMIMTPGIDGLDTYRQILKLHPGQKAIIASGFSETGRVEEALNLGDGEYIKKPYTLAKIGITVQRVLAS